MVDELKKPEIQEGSSQLAGSLVVPDQILPPNLFVLPVNSAVVFPTLLAPIMVTQPRFVAAIEEAISRSRLIGLLLTRDSEVKETTKPENLMTWVLSSKFSSA